MAEFTELFWPCNFPKIDTFVHKTELISRTVIERTFVFKDTFGMVHCKTDIFV